MVSDSSLFRHRKQVRAYSRGGHDWSEWLPAITKARPCPYAPLCSTAKA
jgi:ATP-dependent DNA ligase